ncbi:MAG: hypothetical protein HY332_13350 [Chloroflexi bacterium]|nr:hypothetical protein [Chloroflexota bacterium]
MERRGVPAALVSTEPFIPTVQAILSMSGVPEYPYAVVAHPIGRLMDEELDARVAAALPQVVRVLTAL